MDDFEKELKIGFLEEAAQSVADVEQCFLSLEENPEDAENLNRIFRLAHNLKGSSKAVGFKEFGEFTHQFESFILKVKNKELKASARVVSLLLRANDHVSQIIEALKADMNASVDSSQLLEEMLNYSEEEPTVEEPAPEEQAPEEQAPVESSAEPTSIEALIDQGIQNLQVEPAAPEAAQPAPVEIHQAIAKVEQAIEKNDKPASTSVTVEPAEKQKVAALDDSIRVSLSKVETLINYVGEMVILQSVLREQVQGMESPLVRKCIQQLGKVSKEIQDISMGLRMVPIRPTFQKMQRIVRDTAQALEKDVGMTLIGETTELDKTILEKINDPLVHLIRNSVDHGIESAEIRVKNGKPAKGQVTLSAGHQAGKLVVEVKDDGGGLNTEKLIALAVQKKIIKPDARLSATEAMNLIFAPGFTTKEKVTDVSGRGVGMDVVKTNIKDLGGEVLIFSELGKGTTFRIVLPLTLAIIEGMVLSYSSEKYVIPLNHVFETLKPEPKSIHRGPMGDVLMVRDENLQMIRLGDFFGMKNSNPITNMIAIIVRSGNKPFAILVDDIIGQYQVVIKQLGKELEGIKGVSGSTILGDGKPALILEPQDLLLRKITNCYVEKTPSKTPTEIKSA